MLLEILAFGAFASFVASVDAVDERILEPGANGTSVVLLSVAHLQQTTAFSDDNGMLRRIAYVETRDGTRPNENIWAVSRERLQMTQMADHPTLNVKHNLIMTELAINWRKVAWSELRKPLYSAIAARLILFLAPEGLPGDSDIEGQALFWGRYYNTNGSVDDYFGASHELEGNLLESHSSQFLVGFGINYNGPDNIRLFISAVEPDPVLVTIETLTGFSFAGFATNNESLTVEIPNTFQVTSSAERNKGILVTAEDQRNIVVYGLNYQGSTSDAFLALPCDRLPVNQYEYYGVSYSSGGFSHFLIVGCENDTVFQIGSEEPVELDRMQTYLWESSSLTGTRLVSDKPLVVYTGHRCTNIPSTASACDHITEQVPPTAIWGTTFMSSSFLGRSSGDIYRFVASQDLTSVSVNCSTLDDVLTYTLASAGSWQELSTPTDSFCLIFSDKPLLVMQFGLGNSFDNIGDPFMMMITPVEQYSNNYVLNVLPEFSTNYITIYVTPEDFEPQRIFVDEDNLESAVWTTVYCPESQVCGHITRMSLLSGEHTVYHTDVTSHVGVSAYGFNSYNSYGYPAGLQLEPVQLATVSFLESEFSVNENEGFLDVQLVRSGDITREAVILIATDPYRGSASGIMDYVPIIEIITFQPRELVKSIRISIRDDMNVEFDESFFINLVSGEGVHLSPFSRAKVVIRNDDGRLELTPRYGTELGGTPIIVTGDNLFAFEEDEIVCEFDGIETQGAAARNGRVLCVSPEISRTGRVPFKLRIQGEVNLFTGVAIFISVTHDSAANVMVENDNIIEGGDMVKLRWSPESILPTEPSDSYTIDIFLRDYDQDRKQWNYTELAVDMPNSGYIEVATPEREPKSDNDTGSPAVFEIRVSNSSTEVQSRKRGFFSKIGRFIRKAVKVITKVIVFAVKVVLEPFRRLACEGWGLIESRQRSMEILSQLPPCPCTVAEIDRPGSGFERDDPRASKIFHPEADVCFRQRKPSTTFGQQCCYAGDGNIIVGPGSGGTIDFIAPKGILTTAGHFVVDVLPHFFCCTNFYLNNCQKYYDFRPSDDCSRTRPQRPAFARGDPHLVTLDGLRYTFNGRGEYTLIETADNMFTLQGRMTLASGVNNTAVDATVFAAIAAKDNNSDTVQLELNENNTLVAIVSGEVVVFDLLEQEFDGVIVKNLGGNTIEALFSSGAYIVAGAENGFISTLQVILPKSFSGKITGLLGNFNGDTSDDLFPRFGEKPVAQNSTTEYIHKQFGVTWIVDSARRSLFVYQEDANWDAFYDPFFTPSFTPTFTSPDLKAEAERVCGDDSSCLFDIATTGNIEIGVSTLESTRTIEEIYTFLLPVVCSPACEFGACVANNTCKCSEGYNETTCSNKIVLMCEENICENGGACSRHVNDYTCDCSPGYSGFLCDEVVGGADESSNAAVIAVVVLVIILLLVSVIMVVSLFAVHRGYHMRQKIYSVDATMKQLEMEPEKNTKTIN